MRIGSVAQHQGTSTSYPLYAAGCCGVTPIPTGDYEGNSLLDIAANAEQQVPFGKLTGQALAGRTARFRMTSILLLVLVFLV